MAREAADSPPRPAELEAEPRSRAPRKAGGARGPGVPRGSTRADRRLPGGLRFSPPRPRREASTRRCATRCSPAASGSGRSLPSRPRARSALSPSASSRRRRDRADPHLLADPRRPAGDGRRRASPRAADVARQVRRERRDPRRRWSLRRGDSPVLRASRRAGARAGGARASCWRRSAWTGWSAASTWT